MHINVDTFFLIMYFAWCSMHLIEVSCGSLNYLLPSINIVIDPF